MKVPMVALADGHEIPQVGLGLWRVKDHAEFNTSFQAAATAGYRHFDTAQIYENEQFLGEAWRASGLKRKELFITTKIWIKNFGRHHLRKSFEESLQRLQTDYADLLLLHFPVTLMRKKAWQELEKIQAAGGAKSIGVSNYTVRHLEEMRGYATVLPVINQVELHVFLQQPELIKYCHERNIVIEAYSPLAHAKAMDNEVIAGIAKKHGKTYAQVMLRWCVEQDLVILPKSITPSRIRDNLRVFDFKLDPDDLRAIAKQDHEMRTAWNPVHVP